MICPDCLENNPSGEWIVAWQDDEWSLIYCPNCYVLVGVPKTKSALGILSDEELQEIRDIFDLNS